MQNADSNTENMHIITASNANKKLFFQGWKTSVEAFSQGKGSLSHRCSSILSQLDSSHLDEAISWSSSEGEEDKSNSQLVRPARTLASQINFGDCKRVHRRGRRHSSAQFVRSVEKRLKSEQKKGNNVVSSSKLEESINIPDSSHSQEHANNVSEPFDEPNWVNNLSILNKRINLSVNSDSFLSSDPVGDSQMPTPEKRSQDNKVTSPILASGKAKNRKRKRNCNSKNIIKMNEESSSVIHTESSPVLQLGSPVFKITSHRKRSSCKVPQASLVKSEKKIDKSESVATANPISSSQNHTPIASENDLVIPPTNLEKVSGAPLSPVIGNSFGKRRKAMVVDKLISPILGSKTKSSRPRKVQKLILKNKLSCSVLESTEHLNMSLQYERCKEPSNSDVNCEKSFKVSDLTSPEHIATAKRSLDFSVQSRNIDKEIISCDTGIITDPTGNDHSQIELKKSSWDNQNNLIRDGLPSLKVNLPMADSAGSGCSQLIEEINTEQVNFDNVPKLVKTPVPSKKKKKLSLSKKEVSTLTTSKKCSEVIKLPGLPVQSGEIDVRRVSSGEIDVRKVSSEKDKSSNHQQIGVSSSKCNQSAQNKQILGKRQFTPSKKSTNFTLLIEEENSEPMEFASQDVFLPPVCLKNKEVSTPTTSKKCSEVIKLPGLPVQSGEIDARRVSSGEIDVRKVSSEKDKSSHHQQIGVSSSKCNQSAQNKQILGKRQFTPSKKSTNFTLLIEEENSEPMEFASQDVFLSPVCLKNKDTPKNPCSSFRKSNIASDTQNEDADIDSCSSQSLDNSQHSQIEKLPSSCVSSLITISQTSSPVAPTVVSGLSAETLPDDFNAPPKKGKKKLKPDGLASRLQRLLNRQRSSSRIWQFKRSKESKSNSIPTVNSTRNTSMVLTINHTWVEYSHVIIQGCVEADMSTGTLPSCLNSTSNHVVLVLDPYVADKLGKIMCAKKIRVFPPWQALKLRGISLILCAYCIEVIEVDSRESIESIQISGRPITVPIEEGYECFLGATLSDIIFPTTVEKPTCLFQCTEANEDEGLNEGTEGPAGQCTISSLVSNYYVGGATCDTLNLTVLRAFQFRQAESDKISSSYPSWSILGQDVSGEMCEVLLGSEHVHPSGSIWSYIKSGRITGQVFCFVGFFPAQRISPFRVSSLWRVVSNISAGPCDQHVFYVLAASSAQWECKALDSKKKLDKIQLHFTPLPRILTKEPISNSEPKRVNIICRTLHSTYERLYVTDTETSPSITVISVNPTAFLSPVVFKTPVLVILDLEVFTSDLRVDKYTRISSIDGVDSCFIKDFHNTELHHYLADLNPTLPHLQKDSLPRSLAVFFGTIVGVDEDSAYMWPACGICENELLSLGDNSEKYRCEKCNNQCDNFILHMSLQVLCSCPNLPANSSVRLKLLQKTIEELLPPALAGDEGYDMNTVLGQKLGPLRCEIIGVKDQHFTLQELPSNLP